MLIFLIIIYLLVGLGMAGKYYEDEETILMCSICLLLWPMAAGYLLANKV